MDEPQLFCYYMMIIIAAALQALWVSSIAVALVMWTTEPLVGMLPITAFVGVIELFAGFLFWAEDQA